MLKKLEQIKLIAVCLLFGIGYSQDGEEGGSQSSQDLYIAFDQTSGNTNNLVSGAEYSYSLVGELGPLTDTEFSISFGGNYATLDEEPYALDGNLHTQFDLWANKTYSPFFFFDYSYDRSLGLINRTDLAVGGKMRVGRIFSVSYAYMFEDEEYDSVATFSRHSIRPKVKLVLADGAFFMDLRTFYKPRVDDTNEYLWENELRISLATLYELLSIDFSFNHSFNSRYDENDVLKPMDEWDYDWKNDLAKPTYYKSTDYSVSLGLSFSM